jgi:hypothetical protein
MTTTAAPDTTGVKRPAWLLILTLPAFIVFLGVATVTVAAQTDASSAELTLAQLNELGIVWVAVHLLWVTPPLLAAVGLALLARTWRMPHATAVTILGWAAGALALAYLVVQLLAFGFDGDTWGDSPLYPLGVALSVALGWFGTLPATILVSVALARRGVARMTALTVAVLVALYVVFELLVYLPVLFGSASLAETAGLPPFLLGFFWAVLGIGLLRSRVPSSA